MNVSYDMSKQLIVSIVLLLIMNACATPMSSSRKNIIEQYRQALKETTLATPVDVAVGDISNNYVVAVPSHVNAILKPTFDPSNPVRRKADMSRRFDVKVDGLPIQTFLVSLVKNTEINIVPHPELDAKVSLNLKNVSINEVLISLSNSYGIDFEFDGASYNVFKTRLRSKIFRIDYLNVDRYGKSQVRVSSGQISEARKTQNSNTSGNDGANKSKGSSSNLSGTEVNTISENQFWTDLQRSIEAIVGNGDNKSVVVNAHSGVIIVRALPVELRSVDVYLNMTQTIISRQVLLEAKIIEVVLSDSHQTGINWSAFAGKNNNSLLVGQTGGGSILNGSGLSGIANSSGDLNPRNYNPITGTLASAFGGVFSMALKTRNFSTFIEALETQGDVHVLSSPRISTINNQKAIIKVGSDEFFVTGIETETVTNTTTSTSVNVELTPFFSGVALDVTPQINDNGMVTLHVHPSVSHVREKIKEIAVSNNDSFGIPLALSTIRESDSIVQAKSGQVIVIGGLMQNSIDDSSAGVPLLADLPLIGGLFRHKKNSSRKSELVILLRPIVINNDKQWDSILASDLSGNLRGM